MNSLYKYIQNQIKKDINEYNLSLEIYYNKLLQFKHYKSLFFFIIYKNNTIYTICNKGDNRKSLILNIVKNIIDKMKLKNKILPDFFLPFYVSDTYFYQDNDMFFFIEAKPRNKKGILYPDQNYYYINIENKLIDYDQFKELLKKKDCSNYNKKEPIIYFSGANTGENKHNIRMKFNEIVSDYKNKNYEINVGTQYVPMYDFCKYKYLLNLPGHQPWSYRMSKILLMKSLVFDISVYQTYIYEKNGKKIINKNDKWIQFYTDYFVEGKDYIQINYEWTENITSNSKVNNIYKKCNTLFNKYENSIEDYKKIVNSAYKKANRLNISLFNKTFENLIEYFIESLYKSNTKSIIRKFIDKLLLFDN